MLALMLALTQLPHWIDGQTTGHPGVLLGPHGSGRFSGIQFSGLSGHLSRVPPSTPRMAVVHPSVPWSGWIDGFRVNAFWTSMKAMFKGCRSRWCWRMMAWSSQIESAAPSLDWKTFCLGLNGKWISNRLARIRWKHLMMMSAIVIIIIIIVFIVIIETTYVYLYKSLTSTWDGQTTGHPGVLLGPHGSGL